MTDLDMELRAMLRERAGDIDTLPAHFTDLESVEVLGTSRRHTGWLVAAAVAAVLAIVGTLFAIRPGPGHRAPATTHSPAATRSSTAPVPPPVVRKNEVALQWQLGIDLPTGYELMDRALGPNYQLLGLTLRGDPDATCNGCMAPRTTWVKVYRKGAFDPATLRNRTSTSMTGQAAYLGKVNPGSFDGITPITHDLLPTLAWRYAADSWATVSASTPTTEQASQLQLVASHVRIGQVTKLAIPLRLPSLPSYLHVLSATVDLHDTQFGTTITFTDGGSVTSESTRMLTIQLWRDGAGPSFGQAGSPTTVGGRAGVRDGSDIAFPIGTVTAEIAANGPGLSLDSVLRGIQWAPNLTANEATWFDGTTLLS